MPSINFLNSLLLRCYKKMLQNVAQKLVGKAPHLILVIEIPYSGNIGMDYPQARDYGIPWKVSAGCKALPVLCKQNISTTDAWEPLVKKVLDFPTV